VSSIQQSGIHTRVEHSHSGFLLEPDAIKLLGKYNVLYPEYALAYNAEEAVECADRLGYPVVLKVVSPQVIHKSDVGGVLAGLADAPQVRAGYQRILTSVRSHQPEAQIEAILVCKQAPPGLEVIVGALNDPCFGPTVMFGLGGIFAEVLRDVVFRLAPLRRLDALEMIHEVKGYPLIAGLRGQKPSDEEALVTLLLAVSNVAIEHPEIKELDLNPVRLYEHSLSVLDARVITVA
jgi:acetate---CoA ligase (ADP-forming) subunit beta